MYALARGELYIYTFRFRVSSKLTSTTISDGRVSGRMTRHPRGYAGHLVGKFFIVTNNENTKMKNIEIYTYYFLLVYLYFISSVRYNVDLVEYTKLIKLNVLLTLVVNYGKAWVFD